MCAKSRKRFRISLLGDQIHFNGDRSYSDSELLLFDLRRYLKVILALQAVFVLTILVVFGAVWSQLTQYNILHPTDMNQLNANIQSIMTNAASMSTLAVPIVSNVQFATNAMTAAIAGSVNTSAVNASSTDARLSAGSAVVRRSLQAYSDDEAPPEIVTSNDLAVQDYHFRRMMYKSVHKLINTTNQKVASFDPAAVSDMLEFVVSGVNYTTLQGNFVRVMDDLERTSHFAVLASSMLGIAAAATNTSLPTPGQLMTMYSQQKAASGTAPAGNSCS